MINETIQSIELIQASLYNFSLLFSWALFVVSFAIFGLMFKTKGKWGFFWTAWLLSTILTGVIITFLIISPEQFLNLLNSIGLIK